jgi:O-antigen ligase
MQWMLIGYMFLFIHRPFEIYPILGEMRLERVYMLACMAAAVCHPRKRWLPNAQHLALAGFWLAVLLAWVLSPWFDRGQTAVEEYFKLVVFYLMLVSVIHDEQALKQVVVAFLAINAFYMTHSLWEYLCGRHLYRMGFARMIGVDQTMNHPNSFGASIVYALPFVTPLLLDRPTPRMKYFLLGYVGLSVLCVLLTGSRSSFVGLLFLGAVMLGRTGQRWQWAALAAAAVPAVFVALPESLQTRFETIVNPDAGPKSAKVSGEGRIEGFYMGMDLYANNPLTGVGPGAWKPATGSGLESHNLYAQLLGELGTVGGLAFVAVVVCCWRNARSVKRLYAAHPEWGRDFPAELSRAVWLGFVLMLLEGNFGHNLFRFNWLWYAGFLVIAEACVRERLHNGWQVPQAAGYMPALRSAGVRWALPRP